MGDSLVGLAQARFPDLTEAETRMLAAAITDELAICSPGADDHDPVNDPGNGENWLTPRTIRADILQWLCTVEAASGKVSKRGLQIYAAKISGALDVSYATIPFPLVFRRCAFAADISFKNARVPSLILASCWTHTIVADGVDVRSTVLLNEGFHSLGEVLFRDAKIGGSFRTDGGVFQYASGTSFSGNSENALACDRMRVNGSVFLSSRNSPSRFLGEVGLAGAWIGSNLECDCGTFENPGRFAIRADRITTAGSIFLRHGFSATGTVRLLGARMQVLDCSNGTFDGHGGDALDADDATILGLAMFDGSVTRSGSTRLWGIDVGAVSCRRCKFVKFDLRHAHVRHVFGWTDMVDPGETVLDLRDASVESIEDDEASWPSPGNLHGDGLRYDGFAGCPIDVDGRLRWIRLDRSNPPRLLKQLAYVYTRQGETRNAREVLYRLEELLHGRHSTRTARRLGNPFPPLWSFLLKWTIGYGYKLERAFAWMVLVTVIGIICSGIGYREKMIVPTEKEAYAYFAANQQPPASYQRFSSFMYSVEHSVPAINLGVSSSWSANTAAQFPCHPRCVYGLRWWFCAQTLLGWGLSIFFIAGLTGLVKSDK